MRSLGSDNHSGVHPKLMNAMVEANTDHAAAYGTDTFSKELNTSIREKFGDEWNWFHCFNGTAANVMCLKALVKSHHSILCSEVSHLHMDECGAPEAHIGAKLITLKHNNGKICLKDAKSKLVRLGDQHYSQVGALSITQPTELGTCYSKSEMSEIISFCTRHGLKLHIDGARMVNASYSQKLTLKEVIKGADAVSFGGTKNGLLGSELVIIKKDLSRDFKFIRKQSMQLPSKTRFLAAQFIEFFKNDLYLDIAESSCEMATRLQEQLTVQTSLRPNYPVESNAVFVNIPKYMVKDLRQELFFYIWDEKTYEARLMTSFNTTKDEIDSFIEKIKTLEKPKDISL